MSEMEAPQEDEVIIQLHKFRVCKRKYIKNKYNRCRYIDNMRVVREYYDAPRTPLQRRIPFTHINVFPNPFMPFHLRPKILTYDYLRDNERPARILSHSYNLVKECSNICIKCCKKVFKTSILSMKHIHSDIYNIILQYGLWYREKNIEYYSNSDIERHFCCICNKYIIKRIKKRYDCDMNNEDSDY